MGTRNITQVIKDGKTVVSQYCQWDGYPEGQGAEVLRFLKQMNRPKFEANLDKLINPTKEEYHNMYVDVIRRLAEEKDGATTETIAEAINTFNESGMFRMDVSDVFKAEHPTLQRDLGGEILQFIQDSTEPVEVVLDLDFVNNSLFCEWAYVVDLDNNKLEVYTGFNTVGVSIDNRFQIDEEPKPSYEGVETYYPVTLAMVYDLDNLPSEEQFIKDFQDDDEEDTPEMVASDVLTALTDQASKDSVEGIMLQHMVNYLRANMDDFLEAIG